MHDPDSNFDMKANKTKSGGLKCIGYYLLVFVSAPANGKTVDRGRRTGYS